MGSGLFHHKQGELSARDAGALDGLKLPPHGPAYSHLHESNFILYRRAAGVMALAAISLGLAVEGRNRIDTETQLAGQSAHRLDRKAAPDPWLPQVTVLASCGQNARSTKVVGGYTAALLDNIGAADSLYAAHIPLESGIPGLLRPEPQVAVSSTGSNIGWKKSENRERLLICIAGTEPEAHGEELLNKQADFDADALRAYRVIKEAYQISGRDAFYLVRPSWGTIEMVIDTFMRNAAQPDQAEICIVVEAEGVRQTYPRPERHEPEGAQITGFALRSGEEILETDIKKSLRKFCPKASNITLIVDACGSGGMIE